MKIKLVVATRASEEDFFSKTATGRSLSFNKPPFLEIRLFPENTLGLSAVYNQAIKESTDPNVTFVFAHDDLLILDFWWYDRVKEGLENFEILGVAGNRSRIPMQPGWNFLQEDPKNVSGIVGEGKEYPPTLLAVFGAPKQKVLLLDGLFLAIETTTIHKYNLMFDERFEFHFYDIDFCRQAEIKGVSCGTWDISLIHQSTGDFNSESWKSSFEKYLKKYGD